MPIIAPLHWHINCDPLNQLQCNGSITMVGIKLLVGNPLEKSAVNPIAVSKLDVGK